MAKNIIKINKGDSHEFTVRIPNRENSAENYILTDVEAVYFALLYPHQCFEDAILIKGYNSTDCLIENDKNTGEILIKIEPKDTRLLAPGIYYYTIKLHKGSTSDILETLQNPIEVRTLVERTKFIIND